MRPRFVVAATVIGLVVAAAPRLARTEAVEREAWTHAFDRPGPPPGAAGEQPRRIIYLNRSGGTFTGGVSDDSSANESSFLNGSYYIPAWAINDVFFNNVLTCSRLMWGRFNVEVTDQDPGDVPHLEAVLGGEAGDLGYPANVLGLSPVTCSVPVIERSITFIFAQALGGDTQVACEIIAQEVGHSIGLDHELLCTDPMTYLTGCGPKTFQDVYADCHDSNQPPNKEPCRCSGAEKQNSVQMLYERLGAAETEAPAVTILAPADGATVRPGFAIDAAATDNYYVTKVDLWVDGAFKTGIGESTAGFLAPTDIPVGPHTLELRAYDPGGNIGSASISVTIEAECTTTSDCGVSETCSSGVCLGDVGAECSAAEDCATGTCALDDEIGRFCSRECGPGNACPSGFVCAREGGSPVERCYPGSADDGCSLGVGRSAGSGAAGAGAGLATLAALLWGRARRRPTRR